MIYIEFPITGPLRGPLLVIDWIFVLISFELGLIFLIKYKLQREEIKNLQELGYASLFLGISLMILFYINITFNHIDIHLNKSCLTFYLVFKGKVFAY